MGFWQEPVVIAVAVGIPSATVAIWGLIRSRRVDKISEQSGIASNKTAGVAQTIEAMRVHIAGLNDFIVILQASGRVKDEDIRILTKQRDALQKELNRMYRKYGDNGELK